MGQINYLFIPNESYPQTDYVTLTFSNIEGIFEGISVLPRFTFRTTSLRLLSSGYLQLHLYADDKFIESANRIRLLSRISCLHVIG